MDYVQLVLGKKAFVKSIEEYKVKGGSSAKHKTVKSLANQNWMIQKNKRVHPGLTHPALESCLNDDHHSLTCLPPPTRRQLTPEKRPKPTFSVGSISSDLSFSFTTSPLNIKAHHGNPPAARRPHREATVSETGLRPSSPTIDDVYTRDILKSRRRLLLLYDKPAPICLDTRNSGHRPGPCRRELPSRGKSL